MNLTEMKAAIEKLTASLAASDAKVLALETTLQSAAAAITNHEARIVATEASASAQVAAIQAVNTDLEAKLKAATDALDAKIKSSDAKAIDISARAGVPPIGDESKSEEKSSADIHSEFKTITNPKARAEFYAKHRAVLVG